MADPTYANGFWNFTICDVFTGERLLRVPASSARWGRRISDTCDGSHDLVIRGQDVPKSVMRQLLTPNATYIVQSWEAVPFYPDTPVYAGLVKQATFDRDAGVVSIDSYDTRSIFSKRHMVKVSQYSSTGVWEVTNQSVQGLVREVIVQGMWDPSISNYTLPGVWPAQPSGGETLSIPHFQLKTVEDALKDLEARPDGPDTELEPRWNPTTRRLELYMRVGSPRFQDAGVAEFTMNVQSPPFTNIRSTRDGSDVVTHGFGVGSGSDQDMPVVQAGAFGSAVPMMQTMVKDDSTDPAVLLAKIQAEVDSRREPTEQWSMDALASQYPVITNWRLGTVLRLGFWRDEWEDDGIRSLYLVGITGDHTEKITLEVQLLEDL